MLYIFFFTFKMSCKILPVWKKDKVIFNNKDFPSAFRAVIVGQTGLGKTTLLLKLLLYNLDFENLIICSPSLMYQTEYRILVNGLKKGLTLSHIANIFEYQDDIDDVDKVIDDIASKVKEAKGSIIHVETYKDPEELPTPDELVNSLTKKKTLVIIDDCLKKNQNRLQDYFIYGRPLNINTIYLSQSYFKLDLQTIRNNCQVFIVFELTNTDLRNSYEQLGSKSFDSLEEFKAFAKGAWESVKDEEGRNRGYFVVDFTRSNENRLCMNKFD